MRRLRLSVWRAALIVWQLWTIACLGFLLAAILAWVLR